MAATTQVPDTHTATSSVDRRLIRWGGRAGLGGVLCLLGSVVVVVALGLPDASDLETLVDFDDIAAGRVAEHLLYLSALVLFALNIVVLERMLRAADVVAALFGAVIALFGLVIMAASSLLHISTRPLSDLHAEPGVSPEGREAVEHSWAGAQSVFDTMLVTGALLVPVGVVLLGVAMRHAPVFGSRMAVWSIVVGVVGCLGAAAEVVDPSSDFAAVGVLSIVVFHAGAGWRMLRTADQRDGSE